MNLPISNFMINHSAVLELLHAEDRHSEVNRLMFPTFQSNDREYFSLKIKCQYFSNTYNKLYTGLLKKKYTL
jgi:hypothetical protein